MANQSYSVQMGGRTITVALTETNDIENNRSTIGYVITMANNAGYYKYNNGNRMLFKLGGQTLIDTANVCAIQLSNVGQVVTLASGAWVYNHNSDGSGSFGVYLYFCQTQNTANTATIDTTHTCTTIPRATVPQLPASAPIGQAITINLPRANSAWVHDITYSFGALSGQTEGLSPATGAGTSCTFTPPNILHGQIVGMSSRLCTITVTTRQGSTVIGSRQATITLTASAKPVISAVELTEAGSVPASWGVWVQSKTLIRVRTTASAQYASAVTAVTVSFGGKTYAGADITTEPVHASGQLVVTVTDDRGLTQTHTQDVTVEAYQPPRITRFAVHRCDAAGSINGTGTYGKATIEYDCSSVGQNSANWALKYAVQGGSLAQTLTGTELTKTGTEVTGDIFAVDHIYDVVLTVADALGESTAMVTLPSADCMAEFRGDGRGVSIGGYSQGEGLEIYYDRVMIGESALDGYMGGFIFDAVGAGLMGTTTQGDATITAYPNHAGTHRVGTIIAGLPSGATHHGLLLILRAGNVWIHMYIGGDCTLYVGRTEVTCKAPTQWKKYSGTAVASAT